MFNFLSRSSNKVPFRVMGHIYEKNHRFFFPASVCFYIYYPFTPTITSCNNIAKEVSVLPTYYQREKMLGTRFFPIFTQSFISYQKIISTFILMAANSFIWGWFTFLWFGEKLIFKKFDSILVQFLYNFCTTCILIQFLYNSDTILVLFWYNFDTHFLLFRYNFCTILIQF